MANIQCKMCGGVLDLPEGLTYAECPYCGSATTFPKLEDTRKEGLYNRAESLLITSATKFDYSHARSQGKRPCQSVFIYNV